MPRAKNTQVDPADGLARCKWAATDSLLATYHDTEWGIPIRTDAGHLERMSLEVFQCGLSWKIVLVKRRAFQKCFKDFNPERVARFNRRDVDRLVSDPSIIRNRRKIEAIIANARVFLDLSEGHGSYRRWLAKQTADTPRQQAALYPLFRQTFSFMGPETTKCYLMGIGKIDPIHERTCWRFSSP